MLHGLGDQLAASSALQIRCSTLDLPMSVSGSRRAHILEALVPRWGHGGGAIVPTGHKQMLGGRGRVYSRRVGSIRATFMSRFSLISAPGESNAVSMRRWPRSVNGLLPSAGGVSIRLDEVALTWPGLHVTDVVDRSRHPACNHGLQPYCSLVHMGLSAGPLVRNGDKRTSVCRVMSMPSDAA